MPLFVKPILLTVVKPIPIDLDSFTTQMVYRFPSESLVMAFIVTVVSKRFVFTEDKEWLHHQDDSAVKYPVLEDICRVSTLSLLNSYTIWTAKSLQICEDRSFYVYLCVISILLLYIHHTVSWSVLTSEVPLYTQCTCIEEFHCIRSYNNYYDFCWLYFVTSHACARGKVIGLSRH